MKSKTKLNTTILALVFVACANPNAWAQASNTGGGFFPISAFVEIFQSVFTGTKACLIDGDCSVESTDDGYEASKFRAMSNEELEEYVSKRK